MEGSPSFPPPDTNSIFIIRGTFCVEMISSHRWSLLVEGQGSKNPFLKYRLRRVRTLSENRKSRDTVSRLRGFNFSF